MALWAGHTAAADQAAREQLILRYMPLVHSVVGRLGLRGATEYEDLVGQGVLGLIGAVDRFDPGRGVSFSTFAVRHIEGRVRDGLRSLDTLSRTARRRVRQVESAEDHLRQRLGRAPAEAELSASTGLGPATLRRVRRDSTREVISLDNEHDANVELREALADDDGDPLTALMDGDRQARLRDGAAGLPERERAIVSLHYRDGLTLREIAAQMKLSEARVCQLHIRAVSQLRAVLQQYDLQSAVN